MTARLTDEDYLGLSRVAGAGGVLSGSVRQLIDTRFARHA
jgi:hypothetical protein